MDALAGLQPSSEAYAGLPIADAFSWSDVAAAVPRGDWYLVVFRSVARPDADLARLEAYDDWAHAEASQSPGFVHYFKGPLASDGSCLSFCLWTSRAEARAAAGNPAHRDAVGIIRETYEAYTLEFHSLRKRHARASLEFTPYDQPQRRSDETVSAPNATAPSITLGLGSAIS
jgi:hypothetical protein